MMHSQTLVWSTPLFGSMRFILSEMRFVASADSVVFLY